MIFLPETYQKFGSKIHALLDLFFSKSKYTIYFSKVLLESQKGLIYFSTVLRTKEGKEFEYDFVVDLNMALVDKFPAVEIAEFEAKTTIEAYIKALDIYGG